MDDSSLAAVRPLSVILTLLLWIGLNIVDAYNACAGNGAYDVPPELSNVVLGVFGLLFGVQVVPQIAASVKGSLTKPPTVPPASTPSVPPVVPPSVPPSVPPKGLGS